MSESIRSFLAFDMQDDTILNRIATAQKLLVQTGADLKLVPPQNIHITLRFLGDISPSMAEKIFEVMKKIQFTPFTVQIQGLGVFPSLNYPRVVWAGMTKGADELEKIFSQMEPKIQELGFEPDPHGFSPHLTIARVRSGANKAQLGELISKKKEYDFGAVNAACLCLKRSELSFKGPSYSTLKEFCP